MRLDLGRGAERLDPVLADRDRLRLGPAVVHRHDAAVGEDEIGRRRLRRPAALRARLDGKTPRPQPGNTPSERAFLRMARL